MSAEMTQTNARKKLFVRLTSKDANASQEQAA